MVIKIPLKKKAIPSNKNKTPLHVTAKAPPSDPQQGKPKSPLIPFIDKISLVLSPSLEEDAFLVHSGIWTQLKNEEHFQDTFGKAKWGKYKTAKRVILESVSDPKRYPLLQYSHHHKKWMDLRLEFVPVDLGAKGLDELHATLTTLIPNGWDAFIERGRLTRIDVAVDIPGVRMNEFFSLPSQLLTSKQWLSNGTLETYALGKKDGNQTLIYSRKKKRLAKKQEWDGKSIIRVERRLRYPGVDLLRDIPKLANPFQALSMVTCVPPPPDEGKYRYIWDLFIAACAQCGTTAALGMLPESRRSKYRKHLKDHAVQWWDAEAIWLNWDQTIIRSSLLRMRHQ